MTHSLPASAGGVAVGGLRGRARPTGFRGGRLRRLALGAILGLCAPALVRAAEDAAVTPAMSPALVGSLRELLTAARTDPPAPATFAGLKELIPAVPDERVRERLICATAIGLRYSGDMKGFTRLSKDLQARYPDSTLLASLQDEAFQEACATCAGKEQPQHPCDNCKGKRDCPNSKCDVGMIRYKGFKGVEERPCSICKGAGQCPVCKGIGTVAEPCPACKGKGRRETKTRAREVFLLALDRCQAALDLPAPAPVALPPPETPPDSGQTAGAVTETTPPSAPTGSGRTPEHLVPLLKEYGAWVNVMQQRAGMPVAVSIRAEDDAGRAVLHVTLTRECLRQPRDKRVQTCEALRLMWAEKVMSRQFNGRRMAPATIFENDSGAVVRDSE